MRRTDPFKSAAAAAGKGKFVRLTSICDSDGAKRSCCVMDPRAEMKRRRKKTPHAINYDALNRDALTLKNSKK
jgi:hypothetical protein